MKQITFATVRIVTEMVEAIFEMITMVCVGSAVAEDAAREAWDKAISKVFALIQALFPVFQFPSVPELDSSCHWYHDGIGLTLALIAESIQPRAPNY